MSARVNAANLESIPLNFDFFLREATDGVSAGRPCSDAPPVRPHAVTDATLKSMKRLSWLLLLVGVGLLAGCMRVDGDLTISSEDNVSGEVTVAVAREWASAHGSDPDTMFTQILQDIQEAPEEGVSADSYETEDFVGLTLTLRHTPIERISAATSGTLQITHAAGQYQVTGDFSGLAEQDEDPAGPPWQLDLSLTFPHGVTSTDGQVSGSTVTWHLQQGADSLHARGPAQTAGLSAGWWVAIGAGIVLVAGAAWWLLHSRRTQDRHDGGWFAGVRRRMAAAREDRTGRVQDLGEPRQ